MNASVAPPSVRPRQPPIALAALSGADALMILTPWPQYRAIAPAAIASAMRGRVVLDPYAVLDGEAAGAGCGFYTLGSRAG